MNTIDNIMKLADEFRYARTYEWDASDAVEAGQALRTAVTELASTATEYQQAADKMAMEHKTERDTLRQQLAEAQAEVTRLEPLQFRQAPCHKFCEATAFEIEIRNLKKQLAEAQALIEASREQKPVYAFRRKGLDDFCTCSEKRFLELSSKQNLFEVKKLYATPVVALDALKLHKKHMEQLVEIAQELRDPRMPLVTAVSASVRMLAEMAQEKLAVVAAKGGEA